MKAVETKEDSDDNLLTSQEDYFYNIGKPLFSLTRLSDLTVGTLVIIGQPITNLDGIEKLTNLTELWVAESFLKDTTGIGSCKMLKKLYLYSNRLTRFPAIKPLKRLQTLWISGNSLDKVPDIIPREVRELNLADNNIMSVEGLRRCYKLESLNLAGNPIRRLRDIDPLFQLTKLQNLVFADQMYETTPVASAVNYRSYIVRKMPQLKVLDYFKIEEEEKDLAKVYYVRKLRYYNMAWASAWNKYFNEKNQEILKSFNEMRALKKRHYINSLTAIKAEKDKDYKLKEECKKLRQLLDSASFNWECNHGHCNEALEKNLDIKLNLLEMELQQFGNVNFVEHNEDSKVFGIIGDCLQSFLCPSLKRQINLGCVRVDKVIHISHTHPNRYDKIQSSFEFEENMADRFLVLKSPVSIVDLEDWPFEFVQNYLSPMPGSEGNCSVTNSIGVADKEWLTANGIYKNILLTNEKKQGHRALILIYLLSPEVLESCSQEELTVSHVSDKVELREPCSVCKLYKSKLWENAFPVFVVHYHYEYKDFDKNINDLDIPIGAAYESAISCIMENPKFETNSWHGLVSLTLSKCHLTMFGPVTPVHSVKKLDITYNKLSNLQEIFRIFPNLENLYASFNEILSVTNLMEMHRLEELDLSWNRLCFLLNTLQSLNKSCRGLATLNLGYNAFKDVHDQKHVEYFVNRLFPNLRKFNNEWLGTEETLRTYKLSLKDLPMAYLSEPTLHRIKQPIKLSWSGQLCLKHSDFRTTSHIAINEQREITCVYLEKYKRFNDFQIDAPKGSLRWVTIKNNKLTNLKFLSNTYRVREVDVSFNLLQKIGNEFLGLRYLVKLNLMGNYLVSLEGFKGAELHQLKLLNVSKNNLKSFSGIEEIVSIEELYASSNDIRKWEHLEFTKSWKSLRVIDLSDNNINDPSMLRKFLIFYGPKIEYVNGAAICEQDIVAATDTLSGLLNKDYLQKLFKPQELIHMTELTIKKVGLRQISSSSINTMNLTSVNLERNVLTTLSPLAHLKSLKTICLSNNQISSYGESTEDFEQLEVLYLNSNNIADLNPLELSRCPKLNTLFLQDNQIASLDGLRDNSSLVNLVLDRNKLTEVTVNDFLLFFNLKDLYLESNLIKDLGFLKSLKNLKRLFLGYNRIQNRETLENLLHVSKLKEMTFLGNPLCKVMSHYVAIFSILPRLAYIDGYYVDDQLK